MTFGLTTDGYEIKRLQDIVAELELAFKGAFGDAVNLQADSVFGQLIAIMAQAISQEQELSLATYNSQYRDSAEGVALDNVAAYIGLDRLPATFSTVTATLTGTPTTIVPTGSVISVQTTADRFVTTAPATIGGGGTITVVCQAEESGVVVANAGTLIVIETPISGWDSVTNASDADLGQAIETDTALRQRYATSTQLVSAATLESIRSRLQDEVTGVSDAFVFENDTDVAVGARPPHSIECVVSGGAAIPNNQEIADKIFEVKAAGIAAFGAITESVTDSQGIAHVIKFSRPVDVEVYFHVQIQVGSVFNVGVKQKTIVVVDTVTDSVNYDVTINDILYRYTSGIGTTKDLISAGLEAAIDLLANGWTPVEATDVGAGSGQVEIESDYAGNLFVVTVDAKMSLVDDTPNSGDQQNIIQEIVDFSEDEQTIAGDVFTSRYFTPVNEVDDINSISITHSILTPPITAPPGGGSWLSAGTIAIAATELAVFDTLRVSVEIIP